MTRNTGFLAFGLLLVALLVTTLVQYPWIARAIAWVVVGFCGAAIVLGFLILMIVFLHHRRGPDDDLTNPRNFGV